MIDLEKPLKALAFGPEDALIPVEKSWMRQALREIEEGRRAQARLAAIERARA